MARLLQVTLHQQLVIAKTGGGFTAGRVDGRLNFRQAADNPHSLAAATEGGLDQQRETDFFGFTEQHFIALVITMIAGHQRHSGAAHDEFGRALAAHGFYGIGLGTDKGNIGPFAGSGKTGVFRQKTITRVDRLGATGLGDIDNGIALEVGVGWRRAPQIKGFIGHGHVGGMAIGIREQCDSAHTQ